MTKVWGATSTADEVLSGIDLHGKRILVTGVSAGIGVETARALAAHGAQVTGEVPDPEKAAAVNPHAPTGAPTDGLGFVRRLRRWEGSRQSVRGCVRPAASRARRPCGSRPPWRHPCRTRPSHGFGPTAKDGRSDKSATRGGRQGSVSVEDDPAGSGHFNLGWLRCPGR